MLPGKRDFYRCCKARRSTSHVNKEFWQQFQNYAPPSLRVIRTKFARTIIYIYIYDSRLNRPESVSLASLARQLLLLLLLLLLLYCLFCVLVATLGILEKKTSLCLVRSSVMEGSLPVLKEELIEALGDQYWP